jgi:hypothetical protein
MIPAYVAHTISSKHESNIIKNATDKQRKEISKEIENATLNGLYSIFWGKTLYPDIKQELINNGYNIKEVCEKKETLYGQVRIFQGVNISW